MPKIAGNGEKLEKTRKDPSIPTAFRANTALISDFRPPAW